MSLNLYLERIWPCSFTDLVVFRAVCLCYLVNVGLVCELKSMPKHVFSDSCPAAREAELRRLRKMNVAFEEQNAVLQRHTQSMSSARERLEQELALEERRTLALQQQLQAVRQALTASFASLPVPGAYPRR